MKYEVSVVINKDVETTAKELRSIEAAYKWIEGLKLFELFEGNNEEIGSKYKMVFESKGKEQIMYETILSYNPPSEMTMLYEMDGVKNECINLLEERDGKTYYKMITSFKFPIIMTFFIWIFKPVFKKQTLKSMNDFRKYVENKK